MALKKKHEYLQRKEFELSLTMYPKILGKLINDVEPAIEYYKKTGHGNWSSIRMIAPIIESLSSVSLDKEENEKIRNEISLELGITYPSLFWVMYRNGLLHNDGSPLSILMNDKCIGWGFKWNSDRVVEVINKSHYTIDPGALFFRLKSWLEAKISSKENVKIYQTVLIEVISEVDSDYKREFDEIMRI